MRETKLRVLRLRRLNGLKQEVLERMILASSTLFLVLLGMAIVTQAIVVEYLLIGCVAFSFMVALGLSNIFRAESDSQPISKLFLKLGWLCFPAFFTTLNLVLSSQSDLLSFSLVPVCVILLFSSLFWPLVYSANESKTS